MSRIFTAAAAILVATFFAATAYSAPESDVKDSVQPAYTLDPWGFQDPAKFKGLMKDREDLQLKMQATRVKLINSDPDLQKLHKQIMALHKELAIQLDSKKDMRKLNDKLRELDTEIEKLPRK